MEIPPEHDDYGRNGSVISSEDCMTETEKEQLLGSLLSSDSRLKRKRPRVPCLCYLIAFLFLSNVALIAALVAWRPRHERAPQKPWFPPEIPTTELFTFKPIYGEPPSTESEELWNALMPSGRGFVYVKNETALPDLPRLNESMPQQRAVISVFHQIHCLYITRKAYYGARAGNIDQMDQNHLRHCFDYLRQSIMCAGDTTIEWLPAEANGSTGWGYQHTCRDYSAIFSWVESNKIKNSSGIH